MNQLQVMQGGNKNIIHKLQMNEMRSRDKFGTGSNKDVLKNECRYQKKEYITANSNSKDHE
ncbi:MAG: hypothetical protein ACTHJ5_05865 [Ilyomonas sp.]